MTWKNDGYDEDIYNWACATIIYEISNASIPDDAKDTGFMPNYSEELIKTLKILNEEAFEWEGLENAILDAMGVYFDAETIMYYLIENSGLADGYNMIDKLSFLEQAKGDNEQIYYDDIEIISDKSELIGFICERNISFEDLTDYGWVLEDYLDNIDVEEYWLELEMLFNDLRFNDDIDEKAICRVLDSCKYE